MAGQLSSITTTSMSRQEAIRLEKAVVASSLLEKAGEACSSLPTA